MKEINKIFITSAEDAQALAKSALIPNATVIEENKQEVFTAISEASESGVLQAQAYVRPENVQYFEDNGFRLYATDKRMFGTDNYRYIIYWSNGR